MCAIFHFPDKCHYHIYEVLSYHPMDIDSQHLHCKTRIDGEPKIDKENMAYNIIQYQNIIHGLITNALLQFVKDEN